LLFKGKLYKNGIKTIVAEFYGTISSEKSLNDLISLVREATLLRLADLVQLLVLLKNALNYASSDWIFVNGTS
jgi:hypothetical protein